MILSTHIVAEVTALCSRMAIIHEGLIVLHGAPSELTGRLKGRIWRRSLKKGALEEVKARRRVIRSQLHAGQTVVHVLAERAPIPGSRPSTAGSKICTFATLSENARQAAA